MDWRRQVSGVHDPDLLRSSPHCSHHQTRPSVPPLFRWLPGSSGLGNWSYATCHSSRSPTHSHTTDTNLGAAPGDALIILSMIPLSPYSLSVSLSLETSVGLFKMAASGVNREVHFSCLPAYVCYSPCLVCQKALRAASGLSLWICYPDIPAHAHHTHSNHTQIQVCDTVIDPSASQCQK